MKMNDYDDILLQQSLSLYDIHCFDLFIPQLILPSPQNYINKQSSYIDIGIFGNDSYNKNIHNQVIAGLLINNSRIHVINKRHFDYLDKYQK